MRSIKIAGLQIFLQKAAIMQKKLLVLLGVLLLSVFFFMQKQQTAPEKNAENSLQEEKTKSAVLTDKSLQNKSNSTGSVTDTSKTSQVSKNSKPFSPKVNLAPLVTAPEGADPDGAIREAESKSDRALQKEVFADIESRIMAEMQAIPDCLRKAQNGKEALQCNEKLQGIHKEFELMLGINGADTVQNNAEGFVWNETTRDAMIEQLDAGIQPMQELFSCIQAADTDEEQEKCFDVGEH